MPKRDFPYILLRCSNVQKNSPRGFFFFTCEVHLQNVVCYHDQLAATVKLYLYIHWQGVYLVSSTVRPLKPSGYFIYHSVSHENILRFAHTVNLRVLCGFQKEH